MLARGRITFDKVQTSVVGVIAHHQVFKYINK